VGSAAKLTCLCDTCSSVCVVTSMYVHVVQSVCARTSYPDVVVLAHHSHVPGPRPRPLVAHSLARSASLLLLLRLILLRLIPLRAATIRSPNLLLLMIHLQHADPTLAGGCWVILNRCSPHPRLPDLDFCVSRIPPAVTIESDMKQRRGKQPKWQGPPTLLCHGGPSRPGNPRVVAQTPPLPKSASLPAASPFTLFRTHAPTYSSAAQTRCGIQGIPDHGKFPRPNATFGL
jgi:hypothetical protein